MYFLQLTVCFPTFRLPSLGGIFWTIEMFSISERCKMWSVCFLVWPNERNSFNEISLYDILVTFSWEKYENWWVKDRSEDHYKIVWEWLRRRHWAVSSSQGSRMGTAKTEKELREETRARRARQDLKNTPLPLKHRAGAAHERRLFSDGGRKREANKAALNKLTSQSLLTGLSHSKSLTDLRPETRIDAMASSGRLTSSSVSCENLLRCFTLRPVHHPI